MRKKASIIYLIVLLLIFISVPAYVIKKTVSMKSGWNGLTWGRSEIQIKEWIKKNNSNYEIERCPLSHYGVVCWKLTWKSKNNNVPYEYIEFQFKDGKLCAVIETEKVTDMDPAIRLSLGHPDRGSDIKSVPYKEKGLKFSLVERVFYYSPEAKFKVTKERFAVSRLVKVPLDEKAELPEEVLSWRLTKGSYSPSYFEEVKNQSENFPSAHF